MILLRPFGLRKCLRIECTTQESCCQRTFDSLILKKELAGG